ncbi:hypothetical protein A1O1_01401 [Capronia coronata CBS 617.96]|uniref:Ribosome biogenesis protein SLX9 n=1 Tax=Capronia coronata CBS 617.96 TaxID=1182541 RepID=W9Z2S9_9EURO|nr:uncharacterized protein A1O1_01401 [Capronia coronata CBS 617.96]EXJ96275.1 hypothetical protein A1O1_01401 [Capronia coronata CBS 617.96]
MAPLRGLPPRSAPPRKSILKTSSSPATATADTDSLFPSSKKDKRRIKHALLLDRVTKSSAKKPKRRRPNKKLVTTLGALADALPSADNDGDSVPGTNGPAGSRPQDQINIIKRKSMKSRPGALKRREKLDKGERDRFAKNMAQLAASKPAASSGQAASEQKSTVPSASERLAALRGFISQTLETRPVLKSMTATTTATTK